MSNIIKSASKNVAEKSMSDAAACLKKLVMLVCQSMIRGSEKEFQQRLM